jgi:hypothetical protein
VLSDDSTGSRLLDALTDACPLTSLSDDEHENLRNRLAQALLEPEHATSTG